jgi:hypothetical protein
MTAPTGTALTSEHITRDDLARLLRKHPRTLAHWALRRKGPPPIRVGATRIYRVSAAREWLDSLEQGGDHA